jgi:hypothetical protein
MPSLEGSCVVGRTLLVVSDLVLYEDSVQTYPNHVLGTRIHSFPKLEAVSTFELIRRSTLRNEA